MADDAPDLPDQKLLERAINASGDAGSLQDFMVAVDIKTGKVMEAWKGGRRITFNSMDVAQYPVKATNAAAARRQGEVMHKQLGRKQEG